MTLVTGVDTPRAVWSQSVESILNFGNDGDHKAYGPPECGVAFIAPTSGRMLIVVGAGIRDSSGMNRVFVGPEVYRGTDAGGTSVTTGAFQEVVSSPVETKSIYASRTTLLTGLTAGEVHYARVYHYTLPHTGTVAATSDVFVREIIAAPLP